MALPSELHPRLARLVHARSTAALGTLHGGAPYVSMVPYAIAADGSGFLIHVSTLAAHTRDMLADARVSLLVAETEGGEKSPLGLERVSVQATAEQVAADAAALPAYRAAYLARFPDAEQMFGFADFSIFLIRPLSARFVAGFGQAHSLSAESLTKILRR
ncbi:MAG: pyridoxamine 5'-phosphate oxidase family protein [Proteobacteria bacterium]|nr:pyridoxamine 5'-phosphate oxidase family protein [Pseudomonadota bacterium]